MPCWPCRPTPADAAGPGGARPKKGEFADLFADLQARGYVRFRVDGATVEAPDIPVLLKTEKHDIDVVIDRVTAPGRWRACASALAESFEAALRLADGRAGAGHGQERTLLFSSKFACPCAPTRCPSWNRACSRSTRPWGPARRATAWARSRCSPSGWSPSPPLWPAGLIRAGTAGSHLFDAGERWRTTPSTLGRRSRAWPGAARHACTARVRWTLPSSTKAGVPTASAAAKRHHLSKGIPPNWRERYRETDSAVWDLARYQAANVALPDCHGLPGREACRQDGCPAGRRCQRLRRHLRGEPRHAARGDGHGSRALQWGAKAGSAPR